MRSHDRLRPLAPLYRRSPFQSDKARWGLRFPQAESVGWPDPTGEKKSRPVCCGSHRPASLPPTDQPLTLTQISPTGLPHSRDSTHTQFRRSAPGSAAPTPGSRLTGQRSPRRPSRPPRRLEPQALCCWAVRPGPRLDAVNASEGSLIPPGGAGIGSPTVASAGTNHSTRKKPGPAAGESRSAPASANPRCQRAARPKVGLSARTVSHTKAPLTAGQHRTASHRSSPVASPLPPPKRRGRVTSQRTARAAR
jgi:hypothetical protein